MYPMGIINKVRLITETCLMIKKGDRVIVLVCSEEDLKVAAILAAEIKAASGEVAVVIMEPPKGVEPPPFFAEAMKKVDIVISLGRIDFGHTHARKDASSLGLRWVWMADMEMMSEKMMDLEIHPEELVEVEKLTEKLADSISGAKEVHISNSTGTDIFLSVEGRKGLPLDPILRNPGDMAIVPFYAEVACAPVEGKARGTVVVNGTILGFPGLTGLVKEPIHWKVANGRVTEIKGGREALFMRDALLGMDENANFIAELGIGTNFKLPNQLIGARRDTGILGHIHLGLGRNSDLGGTLDSQLHADFLILDVRLELDGKVMIEHGRFVR